MGMSNRISIRQRQAKNTLLHIILEVPENYPWFRVDLASLTESETGRYCFGWCGRECG
jgi:hypothetical protein